MTRHKKSRPQRKIQQVTDSSGWTHVIKGPPGIIDPRSIKTRLENRKSTETKYTLETYLDRFRKHYAPIWKESNCFESLSRTFEQTILPLANITISQCICLGLGSLTAGSDSSSYELAALTSMLEILGDLMPNPSPQINTISYLAPPQAKCAPQQARNTTSKKPSFKTPSSTRSTAPSCKASATPSSNPPTPFPGSAARPFSSHRTSNASTMPPLWKPRRRC